MKAIVLISVVVAIGLTACGGAHDKRDIAATLTELRTAYLAERYDTACSYLTARAQREIGYIGHNPPTTCKKDMAQRMSARVLSVRDTTEPEIRSLEVSGDRATAQVRLGGATPAELLFSREQGAWKLDAIFGASSGRSRSPATSNGGPSRLKIGLVPAAGSRRRTPCPDFRIRTITVEGGCLVSTSTAVTFTVFTVFGDRLYARCKTNIVFNIDRSGAVVINYFSPLDDLEPGKIACGDIAMCQNSDSETIMWRGQIRAATHSRFQLEIWNACFGTCLGKFKGTVSMPVILPARGDPRIAGRARALGTSGLALSAAWDLTSDEQGKRLVISSNADDTTH